MKQITRRTALLAALSLAMVGLPLGIGAAPLRAQAVFDCPAPATAATAVASTAQMAPTPPDVAFPEGGGELTVFAAASLTDAFDEIKSDLEAAHPGLTISYNFAGSQALVTQLGEGARADVFASANYAQMQAAAAQGSIAGEPITFVRNELVVVTPADNPAGIDDPSDLGQPDLRLVLAQADVPVGRYAREAVCLMGRDTATFGADFVARVAGNVVSEEEDVRDVLAKVVLGEADAGIVYVSDAQAGGDKVTEVPIPEESNVIASYPIATVTDGNAELGNAFITYLLSKEGQATLVQHGFSPAS